jgi:uncharacterized cupin superfamily protein
MLVPPCLVHWDEVEGQGLGDAAGSVGVGLQRTRLRDGELLTQPHVHAADEEIVHVLDGNGTLWQDGRTCAIGAGDTIVFVAGGPAHTLIGGDGGLDVLVFETRRSPETAADRGSLPPPAGEPGDRPENVRSLDEAPDEYDGIVRYLARGLATRSGLNRLALPEGADGAPPHCHSAEEELFVVLDGAGVLELWSRPDPADPMQAEPQERHALRPGHVVSRPPGTRVPHSFRAGPGGMTYLAYGTRESNDICWYPRSNKVFLRGLGVIARLDLLAYGDGEPS